MRSEWQEISLGEIAHIKTGKLNSNAAVNGGKYPFFTCSPEIYRIDTYAFDEEAILLAGNNADGNFNIKYFCGKFNAYQRTYIITVKNTEKCSLKYLYYALKLCLLRFKALAQGTSTKFLTLKILNSFYVALPSLQEQEHIADTLSMLDNKIELNQKINENLYEMVNAYYTRLFGHVASKMATVGTYSDQIYSGGTPTTSNPAYWDGLYSWFSSGETRNRFVVTTEKTITQSGVDNSSTKPAKKYDIVMASAGQGFTRGQTSMLLIDTYVNQSVIVIHADRVVLPYLFWNLANKYEELRAISDSSSIRGSLTTKMISAFEIPLVTSDLLQTFSDFAWSVIPKIENNLLENMRLVALRDTLLPKLMAGEIDLQEV